MRNRYCVWSIIDGLVGVVRLDQLGCAPFQGPQSIKKITADGTNMDFTTFGSHILLRYGECTCGAPKFHMIDRRAAKPLHPCIYVPIKFPHGAGGVTAKTLREKEKRL